MVKLKKKVFLHYHIHIHIMMIGVLTKVNTGIMLLVDMMNQKIELLIHGMVVLYPKKQQPMKRVKKHTLVAYVRQPVQKRYQYLENQMLKNLMLEQNSSARMEVQFIW